MVWINTGYKPQLKHISMCYSAMIIVIELLIQHTLTIEVVGTGNTEQKGREEHGSDYCFPNLLLFCWCIVKSFLCFTGSYTL